MKIIKIGKIRDEEFPKVKKCRTCKSVFEYEYRDLIDLTIDEKNIFKRGSMPRLRRIINNI